MTRKSEFRSSASLAVSASAIFPKCFPNPIPEYIEERPAECRYDEADKAVVSKHGVRCAGAEDGIHECYSAVEGARLLLLVVFLHHLVLLSVVLFIFFWLYDSNAQIYARIPKWCGAGAVRWA